MKRIPFLGIGMAFCFCLLAFLTVKIIDIDQKMGQMARPAKLFNPSALVSTFPFNPKWEVRMSESHDRFFHILSQQPLYWLGKGMQAVAFETEDKKYVVKFFLLSHVRSSERSWIRDLLSNEPKEKRKWRKKQRDELFESSKVCFEELSDETGIVYVHLNKTLEKIKGVKLIDKFGQSHRIRGDEVCFVVQRKAIYIVPTLTKLMQNGDYEAACRRLDNIFDLLLSMAKKGYVDSDDALIRNNNIGFAEDRAIYIDTGHLAKVANLDLYARMRYEFDVRLEPLQKWIDVMFPKLAQYYAEKKSSILEQLKREQEASKQAA